MSVALVGAGAWLFLRPEGRVVHTQGGPIDGHSGSTTVGATVEVGERMTYGLIDLHNTTDEPAVLEGIRFEPPPDPQVFELIDVLVAGVDRTGAGGAFRGFPPPALEGTLRPLEGAVVPPLDPEAEVNSLNLVIGARLKEEGVGFWKAVLIDYRVGSRLYTVRFNDAYVLCAPAHAWEPKGCPNPYKDDI